MLQADSLDEVKHKIVDIYIYIYIYIYIMLHCSLIEHCLNSLILKRNLGRGGTNVHSYPLDFHPWLLLVPIKEGNTSENSEHNFNDTHGVCMKGELKCLQQMRPIHTYTHTHTHTHTQWTPVVTAVSTDPHVVSAYEASKLTWPGASRKCK
jgi:hypothetical protein